MPDPTPAEKCKREKRAHDRAKKATQRAWDRYSNKMQEGYRHQAEANRERGSVGNCIDAMGMPLPGCFADHESRAQYAEDQARAAFEEADSYFDEWVDDLEEEWDREDEYCECMNRQSTS